MIGMPKKSWVPLEYVRKGHNLTAGQRNMFKF